VIHIQINLTALYMASSNLQKGRFSYIGKPLELKQKKPKDIGSPSTTYLCIAGASRKYAVYIIKITDSRARGKRGQI